MFKNVKTVFSGQGILVVAAALGASGLALMLATALIQCKLGRPGFVVIWIVGAVLLFAALRPAYKILRLQARGDRS
jgi:hypothetical protein